MWTYFIPALLLASLCSNTAWFCLKNLLFYSSNNAGSAYAMSFTQRATSCCKLLRPHFCQNWGATQLARSVWSAAPEQQEPQLAPLWLYWQNRFETKINPSFINSRCDDVHSRMMRSSNLDKVIERFTTRANERSAVQLSLNSGKVWQVSTRFSLSSSIPSFVLLAHDVRTPMISGPLSTVTMCELPPAAESRAHNHKL